SKIHILPSGIANKIAAGEVVQRPANVVKELVENAIDAKALHIGVHVHDAGKVSIQVIDDGEGMTEDDARMAFRRHATSKISTSDDLENIRTLGFRGEALASIGAVAQVELKTRTESDELATLVRVEGDELREVTKVAGPKGSAVLVKNLFFNTPARRSFLKTRATELKNITDVVTRMAIAYPEVAWQYSSDEEVLLDVPASSAEDRVRNVFGERQRDALLPVRESSGFLSAEGFVGKPDFVRKNRVDQYLFLNRRYIVNRAINHAVFQAYEHLMVKGSYPFYILHLAVDPRRIDVNVHPSKLEVKFDNESAVYRFVLITVRKVLALHDGIPRMTVESGAEMGNTEAKLRFGGRTPADPGMNVGVNGPGRLIDDRMPVGQFDLDALFARRRTADGSVTQPMEIDRPEAETGERIVPHEARPA
ncbi:MAG: DNA mismatch repair endonuclease MutL, partial [Bacteroidota bacterium]